MSAIHVELFKDVLHRLHRTLRDCKNKMLIWAVDFMGLLTLSMVTESLQVAVRCKEETDKEMGLLPQGDARAETDISLMDERLDLLMRLFRQKYKSTGQRHGKGKLEFNPVNDLKDRNSLDQPAQMLAQHVDRVTKSHRNSQSSHETLEKQC